MSKQGMKMTAKPDSITGRPNESALADTSEHENQQKIASLAYEFWTRWNIRRGLVPGRTFDSKEETRTLSLAWLHRDDQHEIPIQSHETNAGCKGDVTMKTIGSDQTYIDYWQDCATPLLLKTQFGLRLREGRFSATIKIGTGQPKVVSQIYTTPVEPGILPTFISAIINQHVLHPNSDLIEVLSGKKSFQQALTI